MVQIKSHEKEKRDLFLKEEMENGQRAMIKKKEATSLMKSQPK
jgi:hypothetical protein